MEPLNSDSAHSADLEVERSNSRVRRWQESIAPMKSRSLYRGYHVTSTTSQAEEGRFRARVAVMVLSGDRTRSQHFLDFETFATEAEADARALAGAKDWIDEQFRHDSLRSPSNFASLG
jgi:hypothetical protein